MASTACHEGRGRGQIVQLGQRGSENIQPDRLGVPRPTLQFEGSLLPRGWPPWLGAAASTSSSLEVSHGDPASQLRKLRLRVTFKPATHEVSAVDRLFSRLPVDTWWSGLVKTFRH
jgi:hypothetical protein